MGHRAPPLDGPHVVLSVAQQLNRKRGGKG